MNRSLIWKGVGILFAVVGLYFMMQSIQFYVECCRQVDWPMETATVVAVEQRWERSGIRSGRKMVYDVDYRYTVDGTVYAGEIYGTVDSTKQVGTTFLVKYDPAAPEHSNHVLSPSVPNLIIGVAGALFFYPVCSGHDRCGQAESKNILRMTIRRMFFGLYFGCAGSDNPSVSHCG